MQNLNTQRTLHFPHVIGLCILAIVMALSCVPTKMAYATTSAELFAEADRIIKNIDALQTDLNKAQDEYDKALEENEAATKAMKQAEARVKAAEERIGELQKRLSNRAHDMYKSGPMGYLEVLFSVSSFEEFLTSWDLLEKIGASDAALVQESKDLRAEAEAARQEYSRQKDIAATKMAEAKQLKEQIQATQAALKDEAAKITEEAMELQAEEELAAERARQAAAAAEAARKQREADRASGNPGQGLVSGSGTLSHPCPNSTISSRFGWRSFDNSFHQGCDFAAPEGTPIYAAERGSVIYATYNGGYNGGAGNWVVISHGNGLVTKYMHASVVYVSPGDQIEKGQNIAAVGNTGNSFGAHLHFQVEVNDVATDPLYYL